MTVSLNTQWSENVAADAPLPGAPERIEYQNVFEFFVTEFYVSFKFLIQNMSTDIHKNNKYCYESVLVEPQNGLRKDRSCADYISVTNQLMEKQGI